MFPYIGNIFGTKKPPASQSASLQAAANIENNTLLPTEPVAVRAANDPLPTEPEAIPTRPKTPGSSARPPSRGRTLKQPVQVVSTQQNCLCINPFEIGGFKSAHELKCTEANGVCYPGLDPNTYNSTHFVALMIKDKLNSNGKIIIPVANLWKSTVNEIMRQLNFFDIGLSVDIPIVILEFTPDKPTRTLIIPKAEFYNTFYTEGSKIKECPEGLTHIILIMERIQPPGPNFNAIDLAQRLVRANVFSGDFKASNAGTVGDKSVLIDWDPKFQFNIAPNISEADRSNLVCYMVLTFLIELVDYAAIKSNNIYKYKDDNKKLTDELENLIKLFLNTCKQLREVYPSIFKKDDSGRGAILDIIKSAENVFDKNPIDMFLNLLNYDPVHNIQLSFYETDTDVIQLFLDTERQQYYNDNNPDPTLSGDKMYDSYEKYILNFFMKYIPFDINCLINMTFEINDTSIENQINQQYKAYLTRYKNLLNLKKRGGSRKRPKTKRRRSHKKKKGTSKMFR